MNKKYITIYDKIDHKMYTVVSVYYKYGFFNVDIIKNDDELRKYCIKRLEEHDEDVDFEGIDDIDIDILINKTINYGLQFLDEQAGWGIVSIIKGDNLIKYGGDNIVYHDRY